MGLRGARAANKGKKFFSARFGGEGDVSWAVFAAESAMANYCWQGQEVLTLLLLLLTLLLLPLCFDAAADLAAAAADFPAAAPLLLQLSVVADYAAVADPAVAALLPR